MGASTAQDEGVNGHAVGLRDEIVDGTSQFVQNPVTHGRGRTAGLLIVLLSFGLDLEHAGEHGCFVDLQFLGLLERLGQSVAVVPGSSRNIKITTQADLRLAEALAQAEEDA